MKPTGIVAGGLAQLATPPLVLLLFPPLGFDVCAPLPVPEVTTPEEPPGPPDVAELVPIAELPPLDVVDPQ
jgi:hypothetical protein